MQVVENEVMSGTVVTLDGKHLVNCRYSGCTVIYGGGDFALTNTSFYNCPFTFSGSAERTFNLLGIFGMLRPGPGGLEATLAAMPPTPGVQ